ncbi:hypothetical protein F5884DRAFT_38736 [Xylogone sp. PMI_703]|nr:hypothetical protein F5884DRAFT_38736 [Xylogone sp. PMI_703]
MQFKASIIAITASLLAANAIPTPQLPDLGGLLGGLTGAAGGATGATDPISGLLGSLTGLVGDLTSALGALPSGTAPIGGSTGGTAAAGGGTTAPGGANGTEIATCPAGTEQYCCNPAANTATLSLDCVVQSVMGGGSTCTAQSVCCANKGGTQSCTDINGIGITAPITLGGLNLNL